MKRIFAVLFGLLAIAALVYLLLPSANDPTRDVAKARIGEATTMAALRATDHDLVILLNAENTTVGFTATKTLAGKRANVHGGWSGRMGGRIRGQAIIDRDTHALRALEAELDVASLWSEHDQLTKNLFTCGFFDVTAYPTATFVSRSISAAGPDGACEVEGNLRINGLERSIAFAAKIRRHEGALQFEAKFALDRHDFSVLYRDNSAFPLLSDANILPDVALSVEIGTVAGPATMAAVAGTQTRPHSLPAVLTETIPFSQVKFDLVLVPGDTKQGIKPFYLGKTEVTWDEFMPWAAIKDVPDETKQAELRALKQRPSAPFWQLDRGFGMERRPALAMSRMSADLYCQWLSKQTGRKYRLPTEKEWEHAYVLGGGDLKKPMNKEEADRSAAWKGNSFVADANRAMSLPVGSKAANKLGIYDMAGNAAEWVAGTGNDGIVRGGDFYADLDHLGGLGRDVQDDSVWNANDPGDPKSPWWFYDNPGVGMRVVCEP